MSFKTITIALIVLITPIFTFAQEEVTIKEKKDEVSSFMKYNHDLGFAIGTVTGVGLSYRHWFNNTKLQKFGIQATFAPYLINKNYQEYHGGISFLYRIADSEHVSLFMYQANSIEYADSRPSSSDNDRDVYSMISNGLGVGVEILALKHLSINVMTGYHLINTRGSDGSTDTSFGLKGELGLFYKF
ncbi:hypothetical protein [Halocola ammonii]